MDLYPTAETWTGTPGAIAPADGNAASAVAPVSLPASDMHAFDDSPRQQDAGAAGALDLGPNNERLEDVKPKLVHALRELVRQYLVAEGSRLALGDVLHDADESQRLAG